MEPLEADDPRHVGRFEIVARLGAGGMGRVYLARLPDGQQFALKMIHQFLSDDVQFRRRFHREVLAAQRVTGENTAALVDADPDARPPWMAVEFVDGPTLSELIDRGGPLKLASSVRLASGMAQALISIHAAGLVHRDLKPSNVLMGADGARLIDFGIAQASGASSLTMTGLVTGSAGFMSPEQAQAEHVTEASDVFALGTVLYFAATGRRPFGEGSMISVTYRVVHADPDLTLIRDPGLRELIANCLMKDPAARPTPRQIAERCPGIADGSWSFGRSGETTSTIAVGQAAPDATVLHPPMVMTAPPPNPPPMVMPRRELREQQRGGTPAHGSPVVSRSGGDGFLDRVRALFSRPWVAIPVGAVLVLAAGTAVALAIAPDNNAKSPTTSGAVSETEAPLAPVGGEEPTSTTIKLPNGQIVTTSIGAVPIRTSGPKSTASATAKPTTRTTATKPGTNPTASASDDTDPGDTDPDPVPTTDPPVVDPPVITTTEAPTVPPTEPAPSGTAAAQ